MVSGPAVKRVKCTAVSLLSLEERPEKTSNHTVLLSQYYAMCVCVCSVSPSLRRTSQLLNCLYQRHGGVRRRHDMLLLLSHLSLVQLVRVITHTSLFSLFRVAILADLTKDRKESNREKAKDTRLLTQQDRTLASYTHLFPRFPVCVYLYPREKGISNTHTHTHTHSHTVTLTLALIQRHRSTEKQLKPSQPSGSQNG